MRLVRGAEFSCVSPTGREERPVSVHLLGYLFDPTHPAIVAEQSRLRAQSGHHRHDHLVLRDLRARGIAARGDNGVAGGQGKPWRCRRPSLDQRR